MNHGLLPTRLAAVAGLSLLTLAASLPAAAQSSTQNSAQATAEPTASAPQGERPASPQDPFEGFNRSIYSFNEGNSMYFHPPVLQYLESIKYPKSGKSPYSARYIG